MSDYLTRLVRRPKGSGRPRQASPLYRWLRENVDRLHRLRTNGKANWSDIMKAAIEAGVLCDETERSYKRCRDVWHRVNKRHECRTRTAPVDRIKPKAQPPSRMDKNWRPEAIERHYVDQDHDRLLRAVVDPLSVPSQPVRPEENENLPEHSRASARRAWAKIQARER